MTLSINLEPFRNLKNKFETWPLMKIVVVLATLAAIIATYISFKHGYVTAYGDAESHLNIAKRVIDSLTPGFAQLGGIWLPLPHLFLVPFVKFDFLWRTGLGGSIVSGIAFVVSALYLYRLTFLVTKNKAASFFSSLVFILNPNILYMQSTPMTELVLIVFFILSSFYFIKFIENDNDILALVFAAFFGFCAALSRYDGWFLVCIEALVVFLMYLPWKKIPKSFYEFRKNFSRARWEKLQGRLILFSTLAFFAVFLWLAWDFLILSDPLYFTHSEFSAKSQQNNWLARGELPGYRNFVVSFAYYFVTGMSNVGVFIFIMALVGLVYLFFNKQIKHRYYLLLILLVPFIFNILTLFLGQSVIFIPHLTPVNFEWKLFNVRYGVMMVPLAAVAVAYLFYKSKLLGKFVVVLFFLLQFGLYAIGYSKVISMEDGVRGLSSAVAKIPDAQGWLAKEYDQGLVLVDDYARTLSIIRTKIPMNNVIYVGNKPYWEESLVEPEKYATWVVMQQDDAVWKSLNDNPANQGRLFKYFLKVYTSPEILIFKRNPEIPAG